MILHIFSTPEAARRQFDQHIQSPNVDKVFHCKREFVTRGGKQHRYVVIQSREDAQRCAGLLIEGTNYYGNIDPEVERLIQAYVRTPA